MNLEFITRYQRQIQLQSIGLEGQQMLANAKVLIVGMGGLGCPAAQYLTGAGIGKIGLVDGDKVALHNLHRQILYSTNDIEKSKVLVAKEKLNALNPNVEIQCYNEFIGQKNVSEIADDYDIILDGSDRFETRYLLDNYCTLTNKVYVYGSVFEYEGQVALFNYERNKISYQSIFPKAPKQSNVPTCSENGILGFLPSIMGSMQALEVVKHICGLRDNENFELIHYNGLNQEIYKTGATVNSNFMPPHSKEDILSFDYDVFCS